MPQDEDQTAPLIYSVRARTTGLPSTDELLATISERVPDPSVFEQYPPVFLRATASNRSLDSYFTRMAESTLRNFAEDATDGVSFLNSHNMRSLGFGQTFAGRYVAGGQQRTDVDLYVMRGLKLNETSNDDFIAAVSGGSIKDTSVGFYPGQKGWFRCGICDARMERFWGMAIPTCGHWPGDEYPVDPKDESKGTRIAFAWVEDHRLAELSAVNDGATPGAEIKEVKARQLIASGEMPRETAERIARRYGIDLPSPARSFPGADTPRQEASMPPEPNDGGATPPAFDLAAQIRSALADAGVTVSGETPEAVALAVRTSLDDLKRLRPLEEEVVRLRPLADEGTAYRADLVEQAITEGKRAMGTAFAEETYRALLGGVSIDTVKRMRDDWKAIGDKQFPGGRLSRDEGEPTPIRDGRRKVPAAARS